MDESQQKLGTWLSQTKAGSHARVQASANEYRQAQMKEEGWVDCGLGGGAYRV